ncbi:hypothetical protein [Salinisphaera sp.]|uniref:hypothetical protein n=1 Tax=Salinisphaera sp. TaxID=1914330 RepID=UPI002D777C28|nr:hypothetical protein [Salinisphaera sp.]HET7314545.1 hypothetical protein [Salinisphaera sp.]
MSIKSICGLGALIAAMTVVSGCAAAAGPGQTIYLDPQTGEVIQNPVGQAPSAPPRQKATTDPDTPSSDRGSGYKPWKTKDGTQMLSVDPSQTPKERVVRCADGSLRMGSAGDGDAKDNDSPNALCGQMAD